MLQASEHFGARGLRPALVEKDYYVTEALRIIAATRGDRVIFKGGTSLSKGWNLIQRFKQRFGGPGEVAGAVLVEAGTASGREPPETLTLQSYLAQFLAERGQSLGADDEVGFPMRLLHFRRTFVEKLFAIHGKVERFKRDGRPIGSYARHYYDLAQLAVQPEVKAMLKSDEYAAIKADYDIISRTQFSQSYVRPPDMQFAKSDALFPATELARSLSAEYETQCRQLCLGPFPTWNEMQSRLEQLRTSL